MKKALVLLVLVLFCFSMNCQCHKAYAAEEIADDYWDTGDYADWIMADGCTREECPSIDDSWLTDDEDMLLLMKTLREWYYKTTEREPLFLNNRYMLLVNPFIFQTDGDDAHKTIYCTCHFEEYYLYSDKEMKRTLEIGWFSFHAFSVSFDRIDREWIVSSVQIPKPDEELIPGWGIGTNGMNGVTDNMITMMSEGHHYDRADGYLQKYLEHTGLENVTVYRGP